MATFPDLAFKTEPLAAVNSQKKKGGMAIFSLFWPFRPENSGRKLRIQDKSSWHYQIEPLFFHIYWDINGMQMSH